MDIFLVEDSSAIRRLLARLDLGARQVGAQRIGMAALLGQAVGQFGRVDMGQHLALPHRHLHLVCRGCRSVLEVPTEAADALVAQVLSETGFRADPTHMAIHGHCARCAEDLPQTTDRGDA